MSYDCSKCPGYCCSYTIIEVSDFDIKRLAKHAGLNFRRYKKQFTKVVFDADGTRYRSLRHQRDKVFKQVCINFDTKKRRCTVYEARPRACRDYPWRTSGKCGYWELLKFERNLQEDPKLIIPIVNQP